MRVKEFILSVKRNNMFENILKILGENNLEFDLVEHEESKSCEDSKNFR